jgi:hypothetical protein
MLFLRPGRLNWTRQVFFKKAQNFLNIHAISDVSVMFKISAHEDLERKTVRKDPCLETTDKKTP